MNLWALPGWAGPRRATINGCDVVLHGTLVVEIPIDTPSMREAVLIDSEQGALHVTNVDAVVKQAKEQGV